MEITKKLPRHKPNLGNFLEVTKKLLRQNTMSRHSGVSDLSCSLRCSERSSTTAASNISIISIITTSIIIISSSSIIISVFFLFIYYLYCFLDTLVYYDVLCYALLYYATMCYNLTYYTMLCYAMI